MKKLFCISLCFFLLLFCANSFTPTVSALNGSSESESLSFDISTRIPSSNTISEDILNGPTKELITAILESDIPISLLACSSTQLDAYEHIKQRSPALQELENRDDASSILLEIYQSLSETEYLTVIDPSTPHNLSSTMCLSLLLSTPIYYNKLTPNDQVALMSDRFPQSSPFFYSITNTTNSTFRSSSLYSIASTPAYTWDGREVELLIASSDFSQEQKESIQQDMWAQFPDVTSLGLPTTKYNCHSYAWYLSSTENGYWIDDPLPYIIDQHTRASSTPSVGSICVYYDGSEAGSNILHSAIVVSIDTTDSGTKIVCKSKWGQYGLYLHDKDYVPSAYTSDDGLIICRYFTYPRNHHDSFSNYTSSFHTQLCSICGDEQTSPHSLIVSSYDNLKHTQKCLVCNYVITSHHTINTTTSKCLYCPYVRSGTLLSTRD